MATTQELLDKLKANLTSIYDKLESKGVQIDGNKNLDNLVLAIDNVGSGGGGGGITEISTAEEMEAFKVEANVGKYAKYVGESTDTYTSGAIYLVKKDGGNIALFDQSTLDSSMGAFLKIYDTPLDTPFSANEAVNIKFTINGGEVKSVASTWLDMNGMTMIGVDANNGGPQTIYQDGNIMIIFMGYCNMNMMTESEGQSYICMPMYIADGSLSSDLVEILSFSNATTEVINPITFKYSNPIIELSPIPIDAEATEKDIAINKYAYNSKGVLLAGSRENPITLTTLEEVQELLSQNWDMGVYRINGVEGYDYAIYQYTDKGLEKLVKASGLQNPATEKDIIFDKQAIVNGGNIIYGRMMGIQELSTPEEMEAIFNLSSRPNYYFVRYIGETTRYYSNNSVYMLRYGSGSGITDTTLYWEQVFSFGNVVRDNLSNNNLTTHIKIGSSNFSNTTDSATILRERAISNLNVDTIEFMGNGALDLYNGCFRACTNLKNIIIRSPYYPSGHSIQSGAFVTSSNNDETTSSIENIYVPDSLVDDYKSETKFASVVGLIKPLSEYVAQ